jgi:hypothetical protein
VNGKKRLVRVSAPFALCAILLTVPAAFAATITVNSLDDPGAAKICALRDAMTAANTKKVVHGCKAGTGDDTIKFSLTGTIDLASELPNVTDEQLTVTGPITISGQNKVEIMTVASYATLDLTKLTLTEGLGAYDPYTNDYEGGAIWNGGTVTLYNTAFNSNVSADLGAAIYNKGSLTVTNSTFTGNRCRAGSGIFNDGKLTVTNSEFQNNASEESGTGILNNGPGVSAFSDGGTGTATISRSIFSNNTAYCGDGCGAGGGIANGGTLSATQSTFSGNSTNGCGGGIYNAGTLSITYSTFSGNAASGALGGQGGGICNEGPLTISNSTFSSNGADSTDHGVGDGGGIENGGALTIINSTFYGNGTDGEGGGIDNQGTLRVTFSTFADNGSGSGYAGGNINNYNQAAVIKSTILAAGGVGGNCGGTITDAGYNISDDTTCGFAKTGSANNGDGIDPLLSTAGLANNGGPTETIALDSESPAIDAIPLADCTDQSSPPKRITTDQRGAPRPDAGEVYCDIGAYEFQDSAGTAVLRGQ